MDVDFYIIKSAQPRDAQRVACRLAEKAWRLGHTVYVHTESRDAARELDELMWTFRQESFVPHEPADTVAGATDPAAAPILIGASHDVSRDLDVLINLALEVPAFFARCQRIAEIVSGEHTSQQAGRRRYRAYREAGHTLRTHNL